MRVATFQVDRDVIGRAVEHYVDDVPRVVGRVKLNGEVDFHL
jgi:hypothetical protein